MTRDYADYHSFVKAVNSANQILFYSGYISVGINKEKAESVYTRVADAFESLGEHFRYFWTLETEDGGWSILHIQMSEA